MDHINHNNPLYSLIEWDSVLLGKNVFQIHHSRDIDHDTWRAIEKKLQDINAIFAFVKIPANSIRDIRFFESLGYRYAENQLKIELRKSSNPIINPLSRFFTLEIINPADDDSVNEIITIMNMTDFSDRYSSDELFGKIKSKKRYENWLKMAIHDPSYDIFKYKYIKNQRLVGFYMAKREETKIYLALLGVCNDFQNKGIGIGILQNVLKNYQSQKYSHFYSYISSINISALNLHSTMGFQITDSTVVLHKRYS